MTQLRLKNEEVNHSTKGNILVKKELLGKYENVRKIFDKEKNNVRYKIYINYELDIFKTIEVNNIKIEKIKTLAYEIFINNHQNNIFLNDNNKILVSKTGINESVEKICNNYSQRELLIEHLKVFSALGKIIESAKLVNQVYERKGRIKYNSWHYYVEGVIINNKEYLLEFEVVAMDSGENHYRVQRLEKNKQPLRGR